MRVFLPLLAIAFGVASANLVDIGGELSNLKPKELLNSPDEVPVKMIPMLDNIIDNVEESLPDIRNMSKETRDVSGEMIKTIFDFGTPRKIRGKKINELLKKLNYGDQEQAVKISRKITAATSQLEETYPLTAKELVTLSVDLLLHEDFLNGVREVQRKMLWKMAKTFVYKIFTDERIQEELQHAAIMQLLE